MRRLALFSVLAAAGCTQATFPSGRAPADALAGRIAGPPQSCVSALPTTSLRAIDPATLVYGFGATIYVNRLAYRCPGLTRTSTMIFELHGSQYCSGDHFRTVETGSTIPGPACFLGEWVPYRRP